MSHLPDNQASNYGWALWHLEMADKVSVSSVDGAMFHAACAQARATLALSDQVAAGQGVYFEGSTWDGDNQ